jgi:Tol biopolymer transport system component
MESYRLLLLVEVLGVSAIFSSNIFVILPQAVVSNQQQPQSAFATFPGENGLIAFSARPDEQTVLGIYVMNSDGTNQRRIDAEKGYGRLSNIPVWSPDGTKIAFIRYDANNVANINVMNYDGSNQIDLTQYPVDSYVFNVMGSWSPDGSKIVFQSNRGGDYYDIYVMNAADGGQIQRLTSGIRGSQYPDWSPDGSKIVFDSNRDGNWGIYVMNADGSGQTRLTSTNNEHEQLPTWSPDGSKIAFQSGGPDSGLDIYVMNADGTGRRQLTSSESEQPTWSPESDKIAFTRFGEIYVMDAADGGNQIRLTGEHLINEHIPDWGSQTTLPPLERDVSSPTLTVSEDITAQATTANGGTVVTYNVTAEDNVDGTATLEEDGSITQDDVGGDINISCSPASGSEFPIGDTEVQCRATDEAGNVGSAPFTVTVNAAPPPPPPTPTTPREIIEELISDIENLVGISDGTKTRLVALLERVLVLLSDDNTRNDASACNILGAAFTNQVNADERRGDSLTEDQAGDLRTQAEDIRDMLDC